MTVGQRIKFAIDSKKISPAELARRIEQTPASVYNYLKGKSVPNAIVMGKIAEAIPGLRAEWVLLGKGEVFVGEDSVAAVEEPRVAYESARSADVLEQRLLEAEKEIALQKEMLEMQREMIVMLKEKLLGSEGGS